MSSMTKISLLALIGAAAAHPSYGGHSKFHSKPAYPTGGWSGNYNSTMQVPAGTAGTAGTASYEQGKTSTLGLTETSTKTVYSTVYGTPQPAVVENVSSIEAVSSKATDAEQCGPATVTVTATEKATVTITPGASSAYSAGVVSSVVVLPSSAGVLPSSAGVVSSVVALPSSKAGEYDASSYIVVSSTPAAETPAVATSSKPVVASSSKAEYEASTPSASLYPVTSIAQKVYSTAAPASSNVASSIVASSVVASSVVASSVVASSSAASSSAAPTSSSTPTYSGTKRGLAYNDGELCSSFGSQFGFAYNWAQTESNDVGAPFIPMMHKVSDSTAEAWLANVDIAVKAGSTAVMGFNEPDIAAQANLTPEAACTAWVEYMNPIASSHPDVTILGPSVSNSGTTGQGLDWLTTFHEGCPDAVVHATNIHFYDNYDSDILDRFKTQVETAASNYGKPVWITEFGLNTGTATEEQAVSFLKEAMDYCDSSDSVQGYSWFMVGTGENQLNTADGLSAVGQVYAGSS